MPALPERRFEDTLAVRERVPLLLGLVGSSGSGKTYSMLRLLTGIEAEVGGGLGIIDTEARRALWYADSFNFRHLDFQAPFGPLDYLAAIEHFAKQGIRNIGVDSCSHEHEGPGGVLDMHESELDRLAGQDWQKRERVKFLAWVRPKAERRRLLNCLLQMNMNFVFCFRAKEKLKIKKGEEPVNLGFQAIAGDEFIYEMTMNLILPPAAKGVPDLAPKEIGERASLKVPEQFRSLMAEYRSTPLDEALGAALACWAKGGAVPPSTGTAGASQAALERDAAVSLAQEQLRRLGSKEERQDAMARHWQGASGWSGITRLDPADIRAGAELLRRELDGLAAMAAAGPSENPDAGRLPGED